MTYGRRQFIQTGLAGGLLLSFSGWLNAAGPRRFSAAEREMLGAVVNAMLDGVLPAQGGQRQPLLAQTVDGIATAVAGLSAASQAELDGIFHQKYPRGGPGYLIASQVSGRPYQAP